MIMRSQNIQKVTCSILASIRLKKNVRLNLQYWKVSSMDLGCLSSKELINYYKNIYDTF